MCSLPNCAIIKYLVENNLNKPLKSLLFLARYISIFDHMLTVNATIKYYTSYSIRWQMYFDIQWTKGWLLFIRGKPQQPFPFPANMPWGPPVMTPDESCTQENSRRNMQKWESDEDLGENATISPILYCNIKHPELKQEYPGNKCIR